MASSPFYTRPAGQLSPAAGPPTAYFGHLERSNSTGSAWSLSPTDALAQNGNAPGTADDAGRFMSRSPAGGAGLSPSSSVAGLDPTRTYSPMERTPSRDLQGMPAESGSSVGTIGEGRKGSSASIGAIGEGRRMAPSTTPAAERREEEAFLGLPTGYFNQDGSFAHPFSGGTSPVGNGSDQGGAAGGASKSRPSSFILDVLPQTRERGGSSGPPTPSLSLDSASQPPSMSATASEAFPLPSPHSLAPSSYLTSTSQSAFGSLPQSPGGHLFSASSRTSSPGPIDTTPGSLTSSPSVEALASKVQTLESNVSTLSNVLANEFRNLREELGALRALVQQQQGGANASGSSERTERGDSPVLTLRSPSPHSIGRTPTLPQNLALNRNPLNSSFNGSMSSLHVQPATSPGAISPSSSVASGFFTGQQQQQQQQQQQASPQDPREEPVDSSSLKDEQIKLLTAQVNSLTTTVSTLLGSPALSSNGFAGVGGAAPSMLGSGAPSPALSQVPARGMTMPLGSPALGLAVPSAGSNLNGRAPPPMLRTASGTGLGRNTSLRSSVNGPGGVAGGSFDGVPMMSPSPSLNGWTDQQGGPHGPASVAMMPSASTGSTAGVGSPMLGGAGGTSSNPPGSLGSKWEMLGVGNELFRAVAKFGLGPPTKIQGKSIPSVIRGQDVVAQAPAIQERIQCYVIPALQILYMHASLAAQMASADGSQAPPAAGVQVVIITATVDQAAQAQRLSVGLGGSLGIRTSLCTGSSHDLKNEVQTLLKAPPHILVGTPQKLVDLFSMRILPTSSIRLLAIDECDQLIARNLSEHVIALSRLLPATVTVPVASPVAASPVIGRSGLPHGFDSPFSAPMARFGSTGGPTSSQGISSGMQATGPPTMTTIDRQMAIFSCTVPQDVLGFATSLQLKEPVRVLVRRENTDGGASPSMRGLKQYYMYLAVASNPASKSKAPGAGRREASTSREWKLEALADLCEDHTFEHAVVFASSLDSVEAVTYKLGTRAIEALALHQDMGQAARQQVIAKFRSAAPGRTGQPPKRVLVVYDALSRGLSDVGQVPLVINFDMPRAVEDYVHRIACATGHNKNSMVLNVVTPNEVDMLRNIESFFRCTIRELPANFATAPQQ
ncbi:hypothetical protein JCM10908_000218 [Rhodotorula pacifica]|uniref:uncharacterized protein n=1 Tax=Rhodotorula pacifica TaxID=1495444 RepID=UPI00316F09DC